MKLKIQIGEGEGQEIDLEDKGAREYCDILYRNIQKINDRTKKHTIEIKELEKQIKECLKLFKGLKE